MPKKGTAASGGKRMQKLGYKPSQLWYTEEEYELIRRAAELDRRPMTQFAIRAALAEAKRILQASGEASAI